MYVMYGISCMTWKQNIKNTLDHPDPKFQHDSIKRDSIQDFPGGQVVDSMLPMHGVVGVTPRGEDSARYVVKKKKREREGCGGWQFGSWNIKKDHTICSGGSLYFWTRFTRGIMLPSSEENLERLEEEAITSPPLPSSPISWHEAKPQPMI